MPDSFATSDYGVLVAMVVFVLASLWLVALAQRACARDPFCRAIFSATAAWGPGPSH